MVADAVTAIDENQRRQVEAMAGFGIPVGDIAIVLDVDPDLLMQTFERELAAAAIKANARVAESLFRKAVGEGRESVVAAIFWLKTRARWTETGITQLTIRHEDALAMLEGPSDA